MKKLFTFVTVVTCVMAFAGCKKDIPAPTEAFKGWLHAIEVCDVDAMKASLTPESVTVVDQMSVQMKAMVQQPASAGQQEFNMYDALCKVYKRDSGAHNFSEVIDGDHARVKFTGANGETAAPMVRTEKGWKLDLVLMMQESMKARMESLRARMPAQGGQPAGTTVAAPAANPAAAPTAPAPAPAPTAAPATAPAQH